MLFDRTALFLIIIALLHKVFGYSPDLCNNEKIGIVGGHAIPIEFAPYMAALKFENHYNLQDKLYCAAAIVHERFLLTAASCQTGPLVAAIGSEKYKDNNNNILMEIEKFICHEAYDWITAKNDICLVKLKKLVPFSKKIAKIDLPDKNFKVKSGTMLNVTGWGDTKDDSISDPDPDLHQTTVPLVSHNCCQEAEKTMDDNMLCAGVKGRGPCIGDAGAPLTQNKVLVGFASHLILNQTGHLCGSGMDVYTKVASFVDWINDTITNNL